MYGMGTLISMTMETVYACPVCHKLLILRQIFVCIFPSLDWWAPVLIYVVDPRFLSEFSVSGFLVSCICTLYV